jgi:hypothetical protein
MCPRDFFFQVLFTWYCATTYLILYGVILNKQKCHSFNKNKEQKGRIGLSGVGTSGRGKIERKGAGGEYGGNAMYTYENGKWDLLKLFQEWGRGEKENDGGCEFNYDIL